MAAIQYVDSNNPICISKQKRSPLLRTSTFTTKPNLPSHHPILVHIGQSNRLRVPFYHQLVNRCLCTIYESPRQIKTSMSIWQLLSSHSFIDTQTDRPMNKRPSKRPIMTVISAFIIHHRSPFIMIIQRTYSKPRPNWYEAFPHSLILNQPHTHTNRSTIGVAKTLDFLNQQTYTIKKPIHFVFPYGTCAKRDLRERNWCAKKTEKSFVFTTHP